MPTFSWGSLLLFRFGVTCLKAEELERATFEVHRKPEQKTFDTHALKSMLGFHAKVLMATGKKSDAEKLRDEARKL